MKQQSKLIYTCNPNHATNFSRKIYHSSKRDSNPKIVELETDQIALKNQKEEVQQKSEQKAEASYPFMDDDNFTSMFNKWESAQKKSWRRASRGRKHTLEPVKRNTDIKKNNKVSSKNRFLQDFITQNRHEKIQKNGKNAALESKRKIIRKSKVRVVPGMKNKKKSCVQLMSTLKSKINKAFNALAEESAGGDNSTQDSARRGYSNIRPYQKSTARQLLPELKNTSNNSIRSASKDERSDRLNSQNPTNKPVGLIRSSKDVVNIPPLMQGKTAKKGSKSRGAFSNGTILNKRAALQQDFMMSKKRGLIRMEKSRLYGY
ncbi:unnamed protein product [Moneuplotes crassus]|uniref:Uncharacterized protein n=1 Tax=Euplotes crassus TaxID=5936 RepID=A0AAD1XK04_EUPCR|nr:unnamed protein product [Moneuplotes crassus]